MDQVLVTPGEANITDVARGLLDTAAALGLPPAVVESSPSKGGFWVPEEVARAYASMQEETGDFGPVEPPAGDVGEREENDTNTGGEDENGQDVTGADEHEGTGPATGGIVTSPPKSMADAQAAETTGPRRYTDEEKAQAVAAVLEGGKTIAEAADEIGASATSVSKWVTAAKNEGGAV